MDNKFFQELCDACHNIIFDDIDECGINAMRLMIQYLKDNAPSNP